MAGRVICFQGLRAIKGIPWSRMHIARLEKSGEFPKHLQLGRGTVAWLETEIDEWLQSRLDKRDTADALLVQQAA